MVLNLMPMTPHLNPDMKSFSMNLIAVPQQSISSINWKLQGV